MSTKNEHCVYEQVLYLGKRKQKWEQRSITIKRNERNRKYVVEVQQNQQKLAFWKSKKPEILEIVPNSHAVIHMDTLDNHSNVIALVHLSRNSHIRGQFFTSEHTQVISDLRDILSRCCNVVSFDVDIEEGGPANYSTGKTQLHIFHDRICISTNDGYNFRLLREWPIDSLTQITTTQSGITLVMANESLFLRTDQGDDIKTKLNELHWCLSLESYQLPFGSISGEKNCDGNSNIVSTTRRHSKSCELLNHLHIDPVLCQRQLSSISQLPFSSDGSVCKEESGYPRPTPFHFQHFSDTCLVASAKKANVCVPLHDNEVNTQRLMELQAGRTFDHRSEVKVGREHSVEDYQLVPPPIPQRQLKPSLEGKHNIASHTKERSDSVRKQTVSIERLANKCSDGDCTIPRTRSFQIVDQPSCNRKRQRHKSDSSTVRKTITELVQPICFDTTSETNSSNKVVDPETSNSVSSPRHTECSLVEDKDEHCQKSATTSEDQENNSKDKIHYVNLPVGSRPSCYLYMNLPDLREAPKEAVSYVNHVFMGRSMKGIYENVFCNKTASSEEVDSVLSPPPPRLQPRQPPPRIPERVLSGRQRSLKEPERLSKAGPLPPPRPPKTHVTTSAKKDIQVQIAVFASRAIASRVWYLRIVVMRHDQDDATFKTVKDREIASKYHLMQTFPFSISSDIVISLKHQCQKFKLTSEDSQEVDYNIIENLVHGFWFVIEFHLEHLGREADQFVGNVCVEPKHLPVDGKCPINKKFNLGITEEFELKQLCSTCNGEQHGGHQMGEKQTCNPVISDYALRKKVCEKLDLTLYSRNNWQDVAAQLEFSADEIKTIEDKSHRCLKFSPMDYVLTTWEQKDPGCSLERLVSILRQLQRLDVVCDLGFSVDLEGSQCVKI